MKTTFTAVLALATLTSEVALASNRCGYFGISTNSPKCAPQYQQAPAPAPAPVPEEAFVAADPYVQPAPAPAQPCQQAPAPAPAPRAYSQPPRKTYNNNNYNYGYQPSYRLQQRRESYGPSAYNSGIELGARLIQDSENFEVGAGLYLRAHQRTGEQRLAIELSADATESSVLTQGALMAYLNPNGVIKPFALLGGGLEFNSQSTVGQAGVGLDIDLFPRVTISGDVRAVQSLSGCFDCGLPSEYLLGNVGLSRKF